MNVTLENGSWLLTVPINNVIFIVKECAEFKIDKVLLVDFKKISRIRKRIGFPFKLSKYTKKFPDIGKNYLNKYKTFAVMRLTATGEEAKDKFLKIVRDELALLSLSQLGYKRRRFNAFPSIADETSNGYTNYLMINSNTKHWVQGSQHNGKRDKIRIGKHWNKYQKDEFFIDLLNIIRGKIKVSKNWRNTLKNAAILAGQSQMSNDLPQAFLLNMIAIEMLLTKRGDHYSEKLPERAEAFLGWTIHWYLNSYEEKIRSIYQKRCSLVHSGERSEVAIEDLLLSDIILLNVITNIVKHPKLFSSKEELIKYSELIQAENILKGKRKNRPKSFRCSIPVYSGEDLKKI